MSRPVFFLLTLLLLAVPATVAADAGTPTVVHRRDAVGLRLTGPALRMAAAVTETWTARGLGGPRASAPAGARFARLGVPALDGFAGTLGGAWFEPEFPGETPPPAGSNDPDFTAFWILHFASSDPEPVAASLRALAGVADAWPIARVAVQAVPDDSLWSAAYHLFQPSRHDIHALEAWDVTTGDTGIAIAIIDTGVLLDHPDLAGQIWINRAELNGIPGVDDDGNGYVDDVRGWDFVALDDADEGYPGEDVLNADPDPNDFVGHGTAVAGVAGAATDNRIGVAGVAWDVRLMALRIGWSARSNMSGEIDLGFAAQAVRYATRMGAQIINCSFETNPQEDLEAAVTAATRAGVTVVFAAGNYNSPHELALRDDVIAVAATDQKDRITVFSSRGDYVDLAAPGWEIATTALYRPGTDSTGLRQPTYTTDASGTSFSAPIVAGVAALVQAQRLQAGRRLLTPAEVLMRLTETADDISAENPGVTGYGTGRVDAGRAVTERNGSVQLDARVDVAGPVVATTSISGASRIAMVTRDGRFLVVDPVSGATVRDVALPAAPRSGLAAADLGGSRGMGFFYVAVDGGLYGLTSAGRILPGWPVTVTSPGTGVLPAPGLGDLDGDGLPEIVWGRRQLFAWHPDGEPLPNFPVGPGVGPFALGPLGAGPGLDVVFADDNLSNVGTIRAFDGKGQPLAGWPRTIGEPAIDVVVDVPASGETRVIVCGAGSMSAFSADGGLRWRRTFTPSSVTGLALADLDGNGTDEIVFARGADLWVFDSRTGDPMPGWPVGMSSVATGPPVIGEAGLFVPVFNAPLQAFNAERARLRGFPKPGRAGAFPTLADFDGDGHAEVFAAGGTDSALFVYDAGPDSWTSANQPWPTARGNPARTGATQGAPAPGLLDDVGPATVADLYVVGGNDTSVILRWTSTGDNGFKGAPARYMIHAATAPLDAAGFDAAPVRITRAPDGASIEIARVGGLAVRTRYWFAVEAEDAAGNRSSISNVVSAWPGPLAIRPGPAVTPAVQPSTAPAELLWQAPGAAPGERHTISLYDIGGRLRRTFTTGPGTEGMVSWDGTDDDGRRVPAGIYFARLASPGAATGRIVLIR